MLILPILAALAPVICIDPGHPSENGVGTRGKKLTEVAVCWKVALALQDELRASGYTVVLTKHTQNQKVTNKKRAEIANASKAALLIRLHCDAGTGSGFATYFPDRVGRVGKVTGPAKSVLAASKAAAEKFHPAAIASLKGLKNSGLHPDTHTMIGGKQGALTGSIYSRVPVLLVEMAVLQNSKDEAFFLAPDGHAKMAKALAAGIHAAVPIGSS